MSRPRRWFLAACLLHVILAAWLVVPGYFVIDEVVYEWMALEAPHTGALEVRTGYREFPSLEYTHEFLPVHDGRTVPQYPCLFPLLASPFARGFGLKGLVFLNLVAFPVLLWLTWRTARLLFPSERVAWWACVLLGFGGYTWEYSLAAWPQVFSLTLAAGAFWLGARSFLEADRARGARFALAAGLVAGTNLAVRIDALTVPVALLAAFVFARPAHPRAAGALALGMMPGLLLLSLTNHAKFGTYAPFSYGGGATSEMAGFSITRMVENAWSKFIDTSALDRSLVGTAMRRSPGGGVVYLESLKTAFVQGMPWLAVLAAPLIALFSRRVRVNLGATGEGPHGPIAGGPDALRGAETGRTPAVASIRSALSLLLLPLLVLIGMMALYRGQGGLALNQRYLMPALPFVSLLGAWALEGLIHAGGVRLKSALPLTLGLVTVIGFIILVWRVVPQADQQEFALLRWPLIVAGFTLAATLVACLGGRATRPAAGRVLGPLIAIAFGWSFAVSFLYDLPRHRGQRLSNLEVARVVKPLVPPGSAFFTAPYLDPFLALIEVPGVRLLFPDRDREKDLGALADFHLRAGRSVYAVFRVEDWRRITAGPLAGKTMTPVYTFEERFRHGAQLVPRGPGLVQPVNGRTGFVLARIEGQSLPQ